MSKIEWCDVTINPIVGCFLCSPGCENCYAERFAARLAKNPATASKYAGVVNDRGKWTGVVKATLDDRDMPHRVPGKNKRVFVGSMSDLFHPHVSDATRDAIFASILFEHIIINNHGHTFMMLTKRAKEMHNYFSVENDELLRRWWKAGDGWLHIGKGDEWFSEYAEEVCRWKSLWPLPNLWLGVTVCNQEEADSKIPYLLNTPAAKRFLSVEPMLGPVLLGHLFVCKNSGSLSGIKFPRFGAPFCEYCGADAAVAGLAWVICGGETGPGARSVNLNWVRELKGHCRAANIPFFFKQAGDDNMMIPDDLMIREFPG